MNKDRSWLTGARTSNSDHQHQKLFIPYMKQEKGSSSWLTAARVRQCQMTKATVPVVQGRITLELEHH